MKITINEDLKRERQNCTFNVEELTNFLDGGIQSTVARKKMESFFLSDPRFKDEVPMEYLSHKERYEHAVRKSCVLLKKIAEWQQRDDGSGGSTHPYLELLSGLIANAIIKDGLPFTVHFIMFVPTIMGQGTMEQQDMWLGGNQIVGTYAQTEMGHGTFIRGLETTCIYDPLTEEFVLNSPTLTSYKWWPGGLGHTCNYAVVVAQLYTQGKCHGIHPFVVQLRDKETWMPLPGIKLGEIGSKLGLNSINNGYLAFDNVRIPRMNMLMKNAKVLKDGTYQKSLSDKLTYGTMIFVRVGIVRGCVVNYLDQAATIATRYSAVRRQSERKEGEGECQILDYQTQQYKLFPVIATSIAFRFAATWLRNVYDEVTSRLEQGDIKRLPELHAMACCLKAVGTAEAAVGVTSCRLACGGHGYMNSSNFPNIYALATASETYEGENTVLLLQTARYLMKAFQVAKSGFELTETVKYLSNFKTLKRLNWTTDLKCMADAFTQVAGSLIEKCYFSINLLIKSGVPHEDAWNQTSIQLTRASDAHCRAFVINVFIATLHKVQLSPELKLVITQLAELICVHWILLKLGDFLQFSNLKPSDVRSVQTLLEDSLKRLRPNAVGLVDSFDIRDEILSSPLGAYDGNVYERLIEEANKSPLNKEPVNESFHKYLKPFLQSNL
ncbi:probable peroxisomal acyl-coenzyme A oxidase 1 [Adelges cooleyi]|uniref:probable peroxisomal acyl-coenzyme A oxidase 1 n=1 Tax=Adelges cooleyi TaxID=133065 RepID=UPI0021806F1F|nr:probable peroxisomal acyl-coenzyme A oxidase 1 [Adelges cooleyi]XP_050434904.1 probable peroxisomal acyl-coenzyme A oxidase 1 [Adelges cooleyi]